MMTNEFEKFIQENRELFDNQKPDPAVLDRIQEQMASGRKKKGIFISMTVIRWAAACLVLAGAGIFMLRQNGKPVQDVAKVTVKTNLAPQGTTDHEAPEIPAETGLVKDQQVNDHPTHPYESYEKPAVPVREAIFARLNNNESPGQRILGAEQAYNLQKTDKDIVDVLIKTMNSDPNTNVRLAALDALSRFNQVTYVKQQLISSLKVQKDPMVQIGLIQLLTDMKETGIINELEKIANDDNTLKEVQDQAYSSIFILKS